MTKEKTKYTIDNRGMYHHPNGRFVKLSEIKEAKRTDLPRVKITDARGKSISGIALSKRYAHTFKCKCRIIDKKYKTKIKGKFKDEDYPIIEHYYTISTSSNKEDYLRTYFRIKHDKDYPDHRLIKAEHTSWREMKLEL
jgi:hypothetical protein